MLPRWLRRITASRARAIRATALALACTCFAVACGNGASEQSARATVRRFLDAYASADARQTCLLLTVRGRERLFRRATLAGCEHAAGAEMRQVGPHAREMLRTAKFGRVVPGQGGVDVGVFFSSEFNAPGSPLHVVRRGGQWLIDGPGQGPP